MEADLNLRAPVRLRTQPPQQMPECRFQGLQASLPDRTGRLEPARLGVMERGRIDGVGRLRSDRTISTHFKPAATTAVTLTEQAGLEQAVAAISPD
jgi:hypothetical protein